jgi:hypothetical protein
MNTNRMAGLVLLGAVAACGLIDSSGDSSPLSFEIREGYYVDPPPPPPHIALILTTATQYPCANYWLESELSVAGSVLHVDVSDRVRIGEVCLTAIGPAQYKVALPVTAGTYTLEFARDGVTDRYTVTVTDTAIEIATIEAQFTTPTAVSFPRGG